MDASDNSRLVAQVKKQIARFSEKIKTKRLYNLIIHNNFNPMVDFSVLDEDELTLLIGYILLKKWEEKSDFKFLTALKLHKIIYEVSEQLQLPITRCWYIRGRYINNPYVMRVDFFRDLFASPDKIFLESGRKVNLIESIEKYPGLVYFFESKIEDILTKTNIIFTPERTYLKELYRDKAPPRYSECYKTSYEFSIFLIDLSELRTNRKETLLDFGTIDDFGYYDKCKILVSNLHMSIKKIDEFNPFFDIIVKYTDMIEEATISIDFNKKNRDLSEKFPEIMKFLNSQSWFYLENIWKLFSKIIAINTVTGPRAETVKKEFVDNLRHLSQNLQNIDNEYIKAERLSLTLSGDDYLDLFENKRDIAQKFILASDILERG